MDLSKGYTRALIEECQRQKLLRNQCAYVLATAFWETARTMKPVVEAFWKSEAWRKRNLRYYPWHGRGFVQLTWERNYKLASTKLNVDLIANPDKALDPGIAAEVLVTGMVEGWFTTKRLSDYITLAKSDFKSARHIINGNDKDDEIADIARQYDADLKREGYGADAMDKALREALADRAPDPVSKPATITQPAPTPAPVGWLAIILALFGRKSS